LLVVDDDNAAEQITLWRQCRGLHVRQMPKFFLAVHAPRIQGFLHDVLQAARTHARRTEPQAAVGPGSLNVKRVTVRAEEHAAILDVDVEAIALRVIWFLRHAEIKHGSRGRYWLRHRRLFGAGGRELQGRVCAGAGDTEYGRAD